MSEYSRVDIMQWILGAFSVSSRQGNELNFACPVCNHTSFYFNVKKQVGYCHSASCHQVLDVEALIDIIGYVPDLAGYIPGTEKEDKVVGEVTLPKGAEPILRMHEDVTALYQRGVEWDMIRKFKLHRTNTHIIVPIYEGGVLVQHNSRRINRKVVAEKWFSAIPPTALRYKYASGHRITDFFLGWDECKLWASIVLVENTFVAMWLRDLNVTTNFGSYLSDTHIDKLVHSNIKHITFLWDEGADPQKAQRKLKRVGIPSNIIYIEGQPDDHSKRKIRELLNESTDR